MCGECKRERNAREINEKRRDFVYFELVKVSNYQQLHRICWSVSCSSAETVEGSALSLKSVDNVESGDGLSLGVFGVDNGVADNVLEEGAEDGAGLLVDVGGDSLDATSACESADSRLGDSEDGLTEGLAAELHSLAAGLAALAFATAAADLSSWCHFCCFCFDSKKLILSDCLNNAQLQVY